MKNNGNIAFSGSYNPSAIYYEEADSLEYVRKDAPSVYRRIDEFLTLVLSMDDREAIGFKLKGFRNFYLRNIKNKIKNDSNDFFELVIVIEEILSKLGDEIFTEEKRIAYRSALDIAKNDHVEVRDFPKLACA